MSFGSCPKRSRRTVCRFRTSRNGNPFTRTDSARLRRNGRRHGRIRSSRHVQSSPGVSLAALKFLHFQCHVLFHGHDPLDTYTTPTLEAEAWSIHNGYTEAEGVAHARGVGTR